MSAPYIPSASTYLPPLFGHAAVQRDLQCLMAENKMPHALMLIGQQGMGKRLLAEHLAAVLLCGASPAAENSTLLPDVAHPLYPQLAAGGCSHLHTLQPPDGKQIIRVEDARTMMTKVNFTHDGTQVVIIDAADQLNPASANAVLKTLEEPPAGVHFIVLCHAVNTVLPTILSRCRKMTLTPLSAEDTASALRQQGFSDSDIGRLPPWAQHNPAEAMGLLTGKLETLETLRNAVGNPTALQGTLQQFAQPHKAGQALNLLPQLLAENPTLNNARLYENLKADIRAADTLNLAHSWVLEKYLRKLVG